MFDKRLKYMYFSDLLQAIAKCVIKFYAMHFNKGRAHLIHVHQPRYCNVTIQYFKTNSFNSTEKVSR